LKAKLPRYLASFQAGTTLQFGWLGVNRAGMCYEEKTIPWSAVEKIEIDGEGQLRIRTRGETWLTLPGSEVPNLHVVQALAEHGRQIPAPVAESKPNHGTEIPNAVLDAIFATGNLLPSGSSER
jgi:hypothetical protein